MLDPDLLKAFVAVAERGGFTRAATSLNRTQSAVSMQIKRLEEFVGFPVLVRKGKRVWLSTEGEALIGYARRILSLNDEALGAIGTRRLNGTVRVGCLGDYAVHVLPRLLTRFQNDHPDAHFNVRTGIAERLLERLGTDHDLVLAMHPTGMGRGEVLCRELPVWAAAGDFRADPALPVPLALHPENCLFRRWATTLLDEQRRPWRCAYMSPSFAAVEAVVKTGMAVAVFKQSTLDAALTPLGHEAGFPRLPEIDITLHLAPGGVPKLALKFAEYLLENLRPRSGVVTPPAAEGLEGRISGVSWPHGDEPAASGCM